jgi:hypothetical protein
MMRYAIALGLLALVLIVWSGRAAFADGTPPAVRCPSYRAHLCEARVRLARGDRAGALAELRSADEALGSCIRKEADGASFFARHARLDPATL